MLTKQIRRIAVAATFAAAAIALPLTAAPIALAAMVATNLAYLVPATVDN
ncbi:hypothetical protein [Nocardia niigatensis]|nr:hypothetical protein [Nocardia niigatensis]